MTDDKEIKDEATEQPDKPEAVETDATDDAAATEETVDEGNKGSDIAEAVEPEPELTDEEKLALRVEELDDQLLRNVAEFENYKKRMARRFEEVIRSANERVLLGLLDVVDNFERALGQSDSQSDKQVNHDAYREGMQLIYDQLKALLDKHDVSPIDAVGKPFDPNLHEAVTQAKSDEYPEGTVALEMSKGYRLGARVLRHSKVGVSKGASEATAAKDDTDDDSGK